MEQSGCCTISIQLIQTLDLTIGFLCEVEAAKLRSCVGIPNGATRVLYGSLVLEILVDHE